MPFEFQHLQKIPDLILIRSQVFEDRRGFLMESYKKSDFEANGIDVVFHQDIHSHSVRGALRGLHYQMNPTAQGKLAKVVKGEVFDVAVDIRQNSSTYGQWEGLTLSEENHHMLYIPPGFAHGFCVMSQEAEFIYKVTAEFDPETNRGVIWDDPDIGIDWPISDPILSDQDAVLPQLKDVDNNFVV